MDERLIHEVAAQFNLGANPRLVRQLESGFQSDNSLIRTDSGDYVVLFIHGSVENVEYIQLLHAYLFDNGIKTARPFHTKDRTFTLVNDDLHIAVQSFLPGEDIYEPHEAIDPLLPFFGKELGRIHQVFVKMNTEFSEEALTTREDTVSYVRRESKDYMPEDDYVKKEFDRWSEDIQQLPEGELTRAVFIGDVGPKDFFWLDGEYTGILDLNAANFDYLILDLVSMMMYAGLIHPERSQQYLTFMNSYFETGPIQKEELKWLDLMLRTRWFVQIFYHQWRYVEEITQGLDSNDAEENLEGVRCGISDLRITNSYPQDHFY